MFVAILKTDMGNLSAVYYICQPAKGSNYL